MVWLPSITNGGTVTGNLQINGQAYSSLNTLTYAATIATDCDDGNVHEVTLTGDAILGAPTNQKAGATYIWYIKQDGTGGHTLTFNSVFYFPSGEIITNSEGANEYDVLSGVSDGTNISCSLSKNFVAA
jgi:hypothetical protein